MLGAFLGQKSWQCFSLLLGVNILSHLSQAQGSNIKETTDCKENGTGSLKAKEKTTAKEMKHLHTGGNSLAQWSVGGL